jgi:hypothetical protein
VFNTLNKRGSPLSGADIIKSDLIENSKLSNDEAGGRGAQWEQTEDLFERENFARLLYMMPFLLTGEPMLRRAISPRSAPRSSGQAACGFLFEQLPRYAHALRAIFAGSIDVGAASAEVNRRVALMKQVQKWDWAPCAIAFLASTRHEPERVRRFFQALDRFTFACELAVVENREREGRYANIIKYVSDDKILYTGENRQRALLLTEGEQMKFFHTLNRSRKRDRSAPFVDDAAGGGDAGRAHRAA